MSARSWIRSAPARPSYPDRSGVPPAPGPLPGRRPFLPASGRLVALACVLAAAGMAACDGGPAPGEWTGTERDSLGVRIVENPDVGVWTAETMWTVQEELSIGVVEGDPELQFGMISGLDVDDEGRIWVLDGQASRIRAFDSNGQLVAAFGRQGQGPGELQMAMQGIFVAPDGGLLVPDAMGQRIARFSPDGEPRASFSLDLAAGLPMGFQVGKDRTLYRHVRVMALPGASPGAGPVDPRDVVLALDPEGEVRDTLAVFSSGGSLEFNASTGMPSMRIFSPEPVWTLLGDGRLVTGTTGAYSLDVRGADGEIETIIRREVPARPVTEGDRNAFLELMENAWSEAGMPAEAMAQMRNIVDFEDEWPVLTSLLAGPDGTLWVQRFDRERAMDEATPGDLASMMAGGSRWDVFEGSGIYLGPLELPEGFTPRRVIGEQVYGVSVDDLGVQRVTRLRILMAGGAGGAGG